MEYKLYKYIQNNELQIETLQNNELFFAYPSLLNDSFDTSSKLLDEYSSFCSKIGWSEALAKKLDTHGICSMSKGYRADNRHLWSLYSGNYSGFAVEYNTKIFLDYIFDNAISWGNVQYKPRPLNLNNMFAKYELPEHEENYVYHIFECFHGNICEKARNRLFEFLHLQKEDKIWNIEDEVRIIINEHIPRIARRVHEKGYVIPLPKDCIANIFIGYRIDVNARQKLSLIAQNLECSLFVVEPKIINGNWDVQITKL